MVSEKTKSKKDKEQPEEQPELLKKLQQKLIDDQEPKIMTPKNYMYMLVYVEDVHLSHFDQFDDNSAAETLRDLLYYKRWYSTKKQSMRKVTGVNVMGCFNPHYASQKHLSKRLLSQFSVIGLELLDSESTFAVVNKMLEFHSA